jgi:hypothetical protein
MGESLKFQEKREEELRKMKRIDERREKSIPVAQDFGVCAIHKTSGGVVQDPSLGNIDEDFLSVLLFLFRAILVVGVLIDITLAPSRSLDSELAGRGLSASAEEPHLPLAPETKCRYGLAGARSFLFLVDQFELPFPSSPFLLSCFRSDVPLTLVAFSTIRPAGDFGHMSSLFHLHCFFWDPATALLCSSKVSLHRDLDKGMARMPRAKVGVIFVRQKLGKQKARPIGPACHGGVVSHGQEAATQVNAPIE